MKREHGARGPITIFGAGIAGLTAAHELVMRGFTVQVIDKDFNDAFDPAKPRELLDRGIGGMARSQWAIAAGGGTLEGSYMRRLWSGAELLHNRVLRFTRDKQGNAVPESRERADELLDALVRASRALGKAGLSEASVALVVPLRKDATLADDARARYLRTELAKRGISKRVIDNMLVEGPEHDHDPDTVYFSANGLVVPAEHGFRFFPSFYRHLFDTMKRTTIQNPEPSERTKATVFQNLVPCDGLGFARAGRAVSFMVPRRAILSFEAIRQILREVLGELEYTNQDIARFSLRLFKYMTSSTARREAEYEHVSWGDFLGSELYSKVSREHIEYGPQMSAALRGSQSDARTQGNITVQLFMDQLKPDANADFTLSGPTSSTWFDHWHDFLRAHRVTFSRGTLEGFEVKDGQVVPIVRGCKVIGTNYVLALSLPGIAAVADSFLRAAKQAGIPDEKLEDFRRVKAFAGDLDTDLQLACPKGPLQHLSGIQYYFDQDVRFWRGHTQYLDSAWGLTSIAQHQFWARSRLPEDQYKSILSVDIGIFDRPYQPRGGGPAKTVWECTAEEIAKYAWEQIRDHHDNAFRQRYGEHVVFPEPVAYALDETLVFLPDRDGAEKRNYSPFLVNQTGKYPTRPGRVMREPGKSKCISCYEVIPSGRAPRGSYVLAGTYMQTYTRLTSMEAANESARHAVNALLQAWKIGGDRCDIWDPEDHEVEDLQWFKDLDEELLRRGLPHFVDVLGWTELPDTLLPSDFRMLGLMGLRKRG